MTDERKVNLTDPERQNVMEHFVRFTWLNSLTGLSKEHRAFVLDALGECFLLANRSVEFSMSISLSSKLKIMFSEGADRGMVLRHWCPACEQNHQIPIEKPNHLGAVWEWNKDVNLPTFKPSVRQNDVCHYNIDEGVITFHGDCKHSGAGTKVPLPDYPFDMNY